jgi:DNA-binding NarL/FixJ family response regulator
MPPFIVHARGFVRETTACLLRERGVAVVEVDRPQDAVDELERQPSAVLVCSEVPPVDGWAHRRRVVLLDGVEDDRVVDLLREGADVARSVSGSVDGLLEAALAPPSPERDAAVVPLPSPRERPVLTRRQVEVVQLIARGHTSHEIAIELGVRPKTVENYKQRVFARLGVQNQAHAVARCVRLGLVGEAPLRTLAG